MESYSEAFPAIVFLAIVIVLSLYAIFYYRWRSRKLALLTERLGLTLLQDGPAVISKTGSLNNLFYPNGFNWRAATGFESDRRPYISRAWIGSHRGREMAVFDLRIEREHIPPENRAECDWEWLPPVKTNSSQNMPLNQTVQFFDARDLDLPDFIISERNSRLEARKVMEIGEKYWLCSPDPESSKRLFDDPQLKMFFEDSRLWNVESHDGRLFICQRRWLVGPAQFPDFLDSGKQIVAVLERAAK